MKRLTAILLPIVLIFIWFGLAGVGGPTFGKLSSVTSNDQASFLPASADSTKVQTQQSRFISTKSIPTVVVIESHTTIHPSDLPEYIKLKQAIANINGVDSPVAGPIPSKDFRAVEYVAQVKNGSNISDTVKEIRKVSLVNAPQGTTAYVTGPGGIAADLISAFGGIDGILLWVAVAAVFIILLLVYRSIVLPFLVLLTAMFALCAAILFVYILAQHNIIKLNGQSQGILSILVIGAATDYSLLLIARYKEALKHIDSKYLAMKKALGAVIEPIGASAATVIAALLCLLFSDLNSNRSLGPIAALGIVFSFFGALTLLSSLLLLFGRKAFWPFEPKFEKSTKVAAQQKKIGFWQKVSNFVSRKPRAIWIVCTVSLIICSFGVFQLKANGVSDSDSILGKSDAVAGQTVLAKHFPAGTGGPVVIVADKNNASNVLSVIENQPGISSASVYQGNGAYKPIVDERTPVIDGKILINATLTDATDSTQSKQAVIDLRSNIKKEDPSAIVGGITAIQLDTNRTASNDLHKIIPIVLAVILLILILLLRSLIAPTILIASVILSFSAALGVSAVVFNHIFHFPGSNAAVPLFAFIFLVALGVDYNIFLMTRVREESIKIGTKAGILDGLNYTGSVITSAGIVLAATFAALAVIPILFLAQIAFIVSFGVLLDTIIVRSLLVPALCYDIGKFIWWPSKLSKKSAKN